MKKSLVLILKDKNYWKNLLRVYWGGLKNACVLILFGGYVLPRPSLEQILVPFVIIGVVLFLVSLAIGIHLSQREDLNSDEKKE